MDLSKLFSWRGAEKNCNAIQRRATRSWRQAPGCLIAAGSDPRGYSITLYLLWFPRGVVGGSYRQT